MPPNANGDDFSGVLGGGQAFLTPQEVRHHVPERVIGVDPGVGDDATAVVVATLQNSVRGGVTVSPGMFVDRHGQRWENRDTLRMSGNAGSVRVRLHKVPDPPPPKPRPYCPTSWERIMGPDLF